MNTNGRYRFIMVMKDNISLESDKMVYRDQQNKYEILAYIKEFGGEFSDYYVGVSNDPKKSLFTVHNVNPTNDPWLYKQALTLQAAKTAQSYFINRLKVDGIQPSDLNEDTDCVYVYKKSKQTNP